MPLPALDLDTRRWADLVDEGRALVPRLAPRWTDHNLHDPGITIIELLAYLVEQDIYRVNRVPERHRRKFLELIGFSPAPARPAAGAVAFALRAGAAPLTLPAGLAVGPEGLPFRTCSEIAVVDAVVSSVQSYDGATCVDVTRAWREGLATEPFGRDPKPAPAEPSLLIGFDRPLPVGEVVSLWLRFDGVGATERNRIVREREEEQAACEPPRANRTCAETDEGEDNDDGPASQPLQHHSLRTVWEFVDGTEWRALDPARGQVIDETRSFSLDGAVRVRLPAPMAELQAGAVDEPWYYLRCRIAGGSPDFAPVLLALGVNATAVEQRWATRQTFVLAPGAPLPAAQAPAAGVEGSLRLVLDDEGAVSSFEFGSGVDGPYVRVLNYVPRTPMVAGELSVTLVVAGRGNGAPEQCLELPEPSVADGAVEVWTRERWVQRDELDSATRTDAVFAFEPTASLICFGDGERGRIVPAGDRVYTSYDVTAGAIGAPAATWTIAGVDDEWNAAIAGVDPATVESSVSISPLVAPTGGADAEPLALAQGRAAAVVWAHERLLELCPPGSPQTLDQIPRAQLLERTAPARAATLLDFERLALDVPGVPVLRARAWGALDARYPCLRAPGTVTVVVLAGLPRSHPEPTDALLDAVWRYLGRRRVIGTRLRVMGPSYVDVRIDALVRALPSADVGALAANVRLAVERFLDPLTGGPLALGWPFGRDVYRSEILELIDGLSGVDHVVELTLYGGDDGGGCNNVCVPPTALVRSGDHVVEVQPT